MEECSSVDYLGSLFTICNTDKYESICLDDRNGHVSCNITMGDSFSIQEDLQQNFFLPYGTVAWISNVIGFWIWISLLNGNAPLKPSRAIKHQAFVSLGGVAYIVFLAVTAIVRVPRLKNRNLQLIAIGHVVAAIQAAVLCLKRKGASGQKEPENQEDKHGEARAEGPKETTNKDDSTPRPSTELARSPSSASTAVSLSEKPGFLEKITSNIPGVQRTETTPTAGEANTEAPEKVETTAEGLWSLILGTVCLTPGHIMIFYGVVGIAKQIFATRPKTDTRQQREVTDTFILFGVITGIGIIISIIYVAVKVSATATQSPHEESADREAAEKKRAAQAKTVREAVIFGVVVLSGILSMWCQYFVLAAAARDTHGLVHLGQTSNLSLVYLIVSKLLVFAF
ncbi:hypothetical protein LZ30DRAFT_240579 [Colletotrichum cereale]|nr:hypothetical protein LZ30DRAFT_240579 [Colletotrichum cereale]